MIPIRDVIKFIFSQANIVHHDEYEKSIVLFC